MRESLLEEIENEKNYAVLKVKKFMLERISNPIYKTSGEKIVEFLYKNNNKVISDFQ